MPLSRLLKALFLSASNDKIDFESNDNVMCSEQPARLDPSRETDESMIGLKIPPDVDVDWIYFVLERMKSQRQEDSVFWTESMPNGKFIFLGSPEDNTILSSAAIIDKVERLAIWMRSIPSKG